MIDGGFDPDTLDDPGLRLPDGRIRVLANYASFELPRLPVGVVNEPTLAWQIASDRGGRQDLRGAGAWRRAA